MSRKGKSKGIALVIVMGLVIVLATLAWVILALSASHYHTTASQIKRAKAFYLAEAGVQWALWKCRTATDPIAGSPFTHTDIEDPPDSGYYPPITISIADHTGGLGVDWDITASVDPDEVRIE